LLRIRLPEREIHIETPMRDGTILPATHGIKFIRPQQVLEARVVADGSN